MNNKLKTILGIVLLVVVIGGAYMAYNKLTTTYTPQEKPQTPSQEVPQTVAAPDFTVFDEDNNEVLLSDFIGKPIVINFWTSWCGYCKEEMPYFDTVYKEMKDDVVFLMIDGVDGQRETVEKGKKYMEANDYAFPVYFDTNQEAVYNYGVSAYPSTVFIDAKGNIAVGHEGALNEAMLREGISMIMESKDEAEYHELTPEEAKKMLDEDDDIVLLDVRTQEEFDEQRIKGAILIPDYEIADRAQAELPDKDATILIYCRSGNRSKTAANKLVEMGYTNVYDFGGINAYPHDKVFGKNG